MTRPTAYLMECSRGCCPGCNSCYGESIGCHVDPCECGKVKEGKMDNSKSNPKYYTLEWETWENFTEDQLHDLANGYSTEDYALSVAAGKALQAIESGLEPNDPFKLGTEQPAKKLIDYLAEVGMGMETVEAFAGGAAWISQLCTLALEEIGDE